MAHMISAINLLVNDYQEALEFYRDKLGFYVIDDISMDNHRWLTISPDKSANFKLIICKASSQLQTQAIGKQAGDAVLGILQTNNFNEKYAQMESTGVKFCEQPRQETYGTVVIFEDLYGNKWDLIELAE